MQDLVSTDFFVVPTATFRLLFVFIVLSHERRRVVHFAVTAHSTAEWTAQQLTNAFPWNSTARCLLRDRDGSYGEPFPQTAKAMQIRELLTAPLTMAECPCGEADRLNPPRLPGPCSRFSTSEVYGPF